MGLSLYIGHFGAHLAVKYVTFGIFQQEILGNRLSTCFDRTFSSRVTSHVSCNHVNNEDVCEQEIRSVERGICPIAELHLLRLTLVS